MSVVRCRILEIVPGGGGHENVPENSSSLVAAIAGDVDVEDRVASVDGVKDIT